MKKVRERFTKREKSWILYDWANSVYATNIMAAIFPIYFVAVAGESGDQWWGIGTSIATFAVALMAPLLGAVGDYRGMKKKLFAVFLALGVVFTTAMAFTDQWQWMLVGYVLSRIGFTGSCLFYDSFLTDVTTPERMDKVSAWGYAMGYIGGSTIPFLISIAVLLAMGMSNPLAAKISVLITSVWWAVFSIPMLKNVDQTHYVETPPRRLLSETLKNIGRTAKEIVKKRGLLLFVLSYFFYIDGVGTVISVSTAYGTTLGLGTVGMILALLVTQIVAVPFSVWFSKLAKRFSTLKVIGSAICVYVLICLVGFYMGFSLEPHAEQCEQALEQALAEISPETVGGGEVYEAAYHAYIANCINAITSDDPAATAAELTLEQTGLPQQEEARITALARAAAAEFFAEQSEALVAQYRSAVSFSELLFWAMAVLVGTVQGGIQAMSRSFFGKLIPPERSNEFFGFFDIFGKFATVLGPLIYAGVSAATGRSSWGVLGICALFVLGGAILIAGRRELKKIQPAGKAAEED